MKFRITMKDPDGVGDCIRQAAEESLKAVAGIDDSEREELLETREAKLSEACEKWFEYKEYLCVEIDTDAGTCVVIEQE